MSDDTGAPLGLQEVTCDECGASLGHQAASAPVQREMWRHGQCPARIARQLGLVRTDYETALAVTATTIGAAYPDFTNVVLDDPQQATERLMRAELAANAVLEALSSLFALRRTR